MRQAGSGSKRGLIRRGRVGRLRHASRVARRDADSHHRGKLLHRRRRPGIVLVRHVSRSRDTSGLILVWWHGVVLLGSVWRIVGIGIHHVLVLLRMLLMLMIRRNVVLRLPPPRPAAAHVSIQIHAAADASGCSLYVLPSRQMAVTHPAGLGDRTVAGIAQCSDFRIYLHRRRSAERDESRS
jgi:hypothetical protein